MSEASVKTRWKKGQSGNLLGRPKKSQPLLDQGEMLEHFAHFLLEQPCDVLGGGTQTRLTRLMLDVVKRAEEGELSCIKFLFALAERGERRRLHASHAAARARTPRPAKSAAITGQITGPITGQVTGHGTGHGTGEITGLRNTRPAHQAIDVIAEFKIRLRDGETLAIPAKPNGVNGAHANGSHWNGSHALR